MFTILTEVLENKEHIIITENLNKNEGWLILNKQGTWDEEKFDDMSRYEEYDKKYVFNSSRNCIRFLKQRFNVVRCEFERCSNGEKEYNLSVEKLF